MLKFTYLLFLAALVTSCVVTEKTAYVDSPEITTQAPVTFRNKRPTYKLQIDDILSIEVKSGDSKVVESFKTGGGGADDLVSLYLAGYPIDSQGYITLPLVGKLLVLDKTVEEAQGIVQAAIDGYLRDATVMVKMVNFKVTVLGNVNSPGTFYIYGNYTNIFEVLGMAGDITLGGDKKRVKLIRKNSKGTQAILLDLTNPNIMRSEYYFLLPGDILYVEHPQPSK
ncbi:polysaccharide biosynthesis/export family protein [Flammeovirgaceae bacterium SG7u.111]|nr:polysaccharide biosynthesis/export family protein [Flammeovirgaceae bacterium SG7u.132]WPO35905.1 polysaccharide biosynthesis/export family protein [Flammeovirgaceae bacterium SG7u.111]